MSELKSKFGKRLKELRKNRGITQEKMAEYIDISIRNLSKIETGITFPSLDTLEKIISVLHCKPSDLFLFDHLGSAGKIKNELLKIIEEADNDKLVLVYKIVTAIMI